MPEKKFKDMPNSPYAVIQSKFKDMQYTLGRQFQQDERALQSEFITDNEYKEKSAQLNSRYNNILSGQTAEFKSRIGELNRIKAMAGRGEMTGQDAYQAGWKMVLPHETYAARFPKAARAGVRAQPLSASALRSARTMMGEFVAGIKEPGRLEKAKWGTAQKAKSDMVGTYIDWRAASGYDSPEMDQRHRNQLDIQWDALMRDDKATRNWFADEGKREVIAEVRALRSRGRLGKIAVKKLGVDAMIGAAKGMANVTPIGRSFQKELNSKAKKHLPDTDKSAPTAEELRRKATPESFKQGSELGYW
jgi:hypothetical protein